MKNDNEQSVKEKWGATHTIEKIMGTDVELRHLNNNQSVCFGDGQTFHWLLTEKDVAKSNLVQSDVSGSLPTDLKRKIEIHIETTEECIENFNIPKYVKELLEQDIELYKLILARC